MEMSAQLAVFQLLVLFSINCSAEEYFSSWHPEKTFDYYVDCDSTNNKMQSSCARKRSRSSSRRVMLQEVDFSNYVFPCPTPGVILPCTCEHLNQEITLTCDGAITENQLQSIFQEYFPVKYMKKLIISNNPFITGLNFDMNDVKVNYIECNSCSNLTSVTKDFILSMPLHLQSVAISGSKLTEEGFPFSYLDKLKALRHLRFHDTPTLLSIPKIPKLRKFQALEIISTKLSVIKPGTFDGMVQYQALIMQANDIRTLQKGSIPIFGGTGSLVFEHNGMTRIEPGAIYDGTGVGGGRVTNIIFTNNSLTVLEAQSIPITSTSVNIVFQNNNIHTIQPDAFFVVNPPPVAGVNLVLAGNNLTTLDEAVFGNIVQYFRTIYISGNPLECGCDVLWLVNDPNLLWKFSGSSCPNGGSLTSVNPEDFEGMC